MFTDTFFSDAGRDDEDDDVQPSAGQLTHSLTSALFMYLGGKRQIIM